MGQNVITSYSIHYTKLYEVQRLLQQREEARKARDWQLADEIRHRLAGMGVVVRDDKIEN